MHSRHPLWRGEGMHLAVSVRRGQSKKSVVVMKSNEFMVFDGCLKFSLLLSLFHFFFF